MRYRLLYMLLLLLAPQVMTAQNYEYWLDSDYAGRVSKYGELGEVSFEMDVSTLYPGIHYLNCRARQKNAVSTDSYDAWGSIKRTMFYVIDTKNSEQPVRVEYWLDSDYAGRVSEATSGGAVAIEKSLSELTSGIHYLNVRSLGAAGQWGSVKRTMFYVDHSVKSFANVRCWIDEDPATAVTQKVEGNTVSLSIDISELSGGDHTLYVQGQGSDGGFGDISSFAFETDSIVNTEPEPYAVLVEDYESSDNILLTFYYDKNKNNHPEGFAVAGLDEMRQNQSFIDYMCHVKIATFDESFADYYPTSTANLFYECSSLRKISGIQNLNTDSVTNMSAMFSACEDLTSLDLSHFNTGKVRNMSDMFVSCGNMTSLDMSGFKTDSIINMSQMFMFCSNLTNINMSGFRTNKVTEMNNMFLHCRSLKTIFVGDGWSNQAVTNSDGMFFGCTNLVGGAGTAYDRDHTDHTYAHIDGGPDNPGYFTRSGDAPYTEPELYAVLEENMNANSMVDAAPNRAATAKTYTMKFYYDGKKTERNGMSVETYREATTREWDNMAESITNVVFDLTVVNDTAITSTGYWFSGFTQLTSIEGLNYLNTSHVADTWAMFEKCSSLKEVNLSNFDTRNVKTMGLMFYGCENLLNLDVSSFNTANVTHTNSMFANCIGLTSLDLSGFNTRKVENMSEMFLNCTHLTTIYAGSDWSTESSAGGGKMFGSCYSLVGGMGTTYDENHVDGTYAHIDGGPDNPGYLTDIADTAKLETVETPTFRFEYMYDMDLTIETETDDAEIYYTLNGRMLEGDDTNFGYNSLSRYSKWSVWGDNKQDAKTERSGYNGSYCLMVASGTDGSFESAQAGYKFSNPLTEGDYYTIRFMARSKSGNGKLQFYCQNDTLPNTRSAADTLTIGSQFADYEVTLKIDNDKTNQFVLNFGAVADTYYIDNVLFGPVISDTTNLLRTRYESPIELRQGVTIKAVAVKEGMKDSEPAVWDYFYEGWMNMLETYEKCKMICDMVEGDPNVPLAMVYDVRMRLEDMLYRYYERRLEERFDDEELLSAADEMRSYASILETMMRGFFVDGVYYHAVDSTHAEVIAPLDYYTTYRNAINVAKEVHYNDLDFQVTSVAQGAFANSQLAAIVWNPTVALKNEDVAVINNPNLLVYVSDASLAPENVTNVVVNGLAKNVELVDADNNNFYCPQAFTAEAISYTREFRQETQVGVSRGWEAIALPFDVQTIMHEKQGMIAPFGNNASNKHFWLRRLSSNGLVSADKMEANVPYIISMPNSDAYPAGFNLPGRVTFSSANVTVPVTETRTLALADSTIMMASTMQRLNRSSSYYALNVGEVRGQYLEGSVFERNYREVRPFEAYTIHRSDTPAPRFVPVNALMGGTTGIEDVIELMSDDRGEGTWHDLQGRKVVNGKLPRGVYIRNGKKVVIR